jgi:hypothetical protein
MSRAKTKDTSWQFIYDELPVNLNELIEEVKVLDEEWKLDTSRQDKLATHKDTEMFQLQFMDYWWEVGQGYQSKVINKFKKENSNICMQQIYNYLEKEYDAKVVRCEIIKMHANSHIPDHIDSGEFLYLGRRIHVPLITNKDVVFTIFGNSINMEVGKWYDINNSLPHSVDNNSIYDRIHIIIDLIENKYMNQER